MEMQVVCEIRKKGQRTRVVKLQTYRSEANVALQSRAAADLSFSSEEPAESLWEKAEAALFGRLEHKPIPVAIVERPKLLLRRPPASVQPKYITPIVAVQSTRRIVHQTRLPHHKI